MLKNMSSISNKLKLILFSIGSILIIIGLIFGFYTNNKIEDNRIELRKNMLTNLIKEKLEKKIDVGLTNAIGFSANESLAYAVDYNDRTEAISILKKIGEQYQNNSNYKGIKIHLHTKDLKSFVRSWKLNSFGDDLSSFRPSLVDIKKTKKSKVIFELGKSGMFIRGIVPILRNNEYLGSLEFMQGVGSVSRDFFKKKMHYAMVLSEDAVQIATNVKSNEKVGAYYVANPKWFKPETIQMIKKANIQELIKNGYYLNKEIFAIALPLKDFKGNLTGYHILAEDSKKIISQILT